MTARSPFADQCTRVYTPTGKRAHLLRPDISPNLRLAALCGGMPRAWHGTGTQAEYEMAASLPLCRYCERVARSEDEAAARRKAKAS